MTVKEYIKRLQQLPPDFLCLQFSPLTENFAQSTGPCIIKVLIIRNGPGEDFEEWQRFDEDEHNEDQEHFKAVWL